MLKQKIIKVCFFTAMIAIHLCLDSLALAEDCAGRKDVTQTPTPPGNAEYPEDWRDQYSPTIYASDDEISPEGTITLYVDAGGMGCPPYSWSLTGTGYNIEDDDGDQITDDDLETITLTAPTSTGTCGTDYDIHATVTVEDTCGLTDSAIIRNTAGHWENCYSYSVGCSCGCACEEDEGSDWYIIGNHRIKHKKCLDHYSGMKCRSDYVHVQTCSEDGWQYTFSYANCCDCKSTQNCPSAWPRREYPYKKYIDYWSCP
jgi:hypothetical protein